MKFALKLSTFLSLFLAVIAAALLFWVSQNVQEKERVLTRLQDRLQAEEESLRVLKAEWDYLNRPDRLEELASKYLDMKSVTVDHVVQSVSAIPQPEEETTAPDVTEVSTQKGNDQNPQKELSELPSPPVDQSTPQDENDFNAVLDDALSASPQSEDAQ
jgi:hypothetical protein